MFPAVEIVGASGFVGTNLRKLLKAQIITKSVRAEQPFKVEGEVVIHLAGIADARNASITKEDYFLANVELTKKVFDAFIDSPAKKMIILSSVKAIAESHSGVITEDTPENPSSFYGESKLAADRYVFSTSLPADKKVYVLRPTIITGPGVKGNLQRFKKYAHHPLGWILSAFTAKRSFCNIKNLGFIIQQLLDREDIPSGIYLVADEEPLSAADLLAIFSGKTTVNPALLLLASLFKSALIILFSVFPIKGIPQALDTINSSYLVSNRKIVKAIGQKLPFTSKEGILSIKN